MGETFTIFIPVEVSCYNMQAHIEMYLKSYTQPLNNKQQGTKNHIEIVIHRI